MNSVEKDNIIQKAICCSGAMGKTVADLYIKGSKCADREFQKLFLLVSYTETLGCYNAPLDTTTYTVVEGTPVSTEWSVVIPCTIWDTLTTSSISTTLTVDGASQSIVGDSTQTVGENIEELLDDLGFNYIVSICSNSNITVTITGACDTESVVITHSVTTTPPPTVTNTNYTATLITAGSCSGNIIETTIITTEYTNCLTEDQADNIATQISKLCDLCDTH